MKALVCKCGLTLAEHHTNFGCKREGEEPLERALRVFRESLDTWTPEQRAQKVEWKP